MFDLRVSPNETFPAPSEPGHSDMLMYYDGPMLFFATWRDQRYLVMNMASDKEHLWLAVPIRPWVEKALREHQISVRDALLSSSTGRVAFIWDDEDLSHHIWFESSQLPDHWLPDQDDTFLNPK
jgi:hypothetical protein